MTRRVTVWNPWRMMPRDPFDMEEWGMSGSEDIQMDLYELEDQVVVELKAPGFSKDDVKVQVESNMITVSGSSKEENEDKNDDRKYYRKEITSMSFSRTAELPSMVYADKAKAVFKNGMLTITLPKREEAKPKMISIDVEE